MGGGFKRAWVRAGWSGVLLLGLATLGPSARSPSVGWSHGGGATATAEAVAIGPAEHQIVALELPQLGPPPSLFMTPLQANLKAPFVELGAMDSTPGETQADFLIRVAQAMDLFSRKTAFEACGVLLASAQKNAWRVRLTTNRSHIACVMVSFDEKGFVPTGLDIHSHPRVVGGTHVNAQDVLRNPAFTCGQHIVVFDEQFSGKDLDRGPGYLVSRGRLLFQRGRAYPYQLRATFASVNALPHLSFASPAMRSSAVVNGALPALAEAAWTNQEMSGLLPTECEGSTGDSWMKTESAGSP